MNVGTDLIGKTTGMVGYRDPVYSQVTVLLFRRSLCPKGFVPVRLRGNDMHRARIANLTG
jgi:hypothetical protein